MKTETAPAAASFQEVYLLETLPLLCRLAAARKHNIPDWTTVEDLRQTVALNLLKWKSRRPALDLSAEEWLCLANTAMTNQIKTFHATRSLRREIQLAEIEVKIHSPLSFPTHCQNASPEGSTRTEVASLLDRLRCIIESLTLREKYVILFGCEDLLAKLIGRRGCGIKVTAKMLEIEVGELFAMIELAPLNAGEIAALLEKKLGHPVTAKQMIEARHRAKAKIKAALDERLAKNDGKRSRSKE